MTVLLLVVVFIILVIAIVLIIIKTKHAAGALIVDKRMPKELSKLRDDSFVVTDIVPNRKFTVSKDNKIFTIEVVDEYPLGKTPVRINNFKINNFHAVTFIKDLVNKFYTKEKLGLVCAHDKSYYDAVTPHFMHNIFSSIMNADEQNTTIFTTDIDTTRNNNQDLIADITNDELYKLNENLFDYIFFPDCGGEWYTYTQQPNYEGFEGLRKIVDGLIKMTKPGGKLFVSKMFNYVDLLYDHYKKLYTVQKGVFDSVLHLDKIPLENEVLMQYLLFTKS